ATVSNAYNRPDQLSPSLRSTILTAARELGYPGPDAAGRALRSGRAGAVGVLLTERLAYAFSDPYAIGFLAGLSEVVEESRVSIVLMPLALDGDQPDLTAVRSAAIDALAILCISDVHPAIELARARGIRIIGTAVSEDPASSWVAIDDEDAGERVARHLTALGHRRIAVIADTNAPAGSEPARLRVEEVTCLDCSARLRGLLRVLEEDALTVVSAGHNATSSGVRATELLLAEPSAVTAVVGLSDVLALGAVSALTAAGKAIPAEVSVCGFDDIAPAAEAGLTTVRQPIVEKGRQVGRRLVDPTVHPPQLLLPIELIARTSTGPVPDPVVNRAG
ncbi:MAG: LacI family DNA-binding transcriptional regulator, partial [Actinomycetes bacterium]